MEEARITWILVDAPDNLTVAAIQHLECLQGNDNFEIHWIAVTEDPEM